MTHRLWCVTEENVLHIGQFNISQLFQRKQNRANCVSVFPSRERSIYFYLCTHPSLIFLSIFFNRFIPTFLNQKILSFSIFDKFSKSLISVVSFCHNRVQRRKFFFSLDDVRRWRRAGTRRTAPPESRDWRRRSWPGRRRPRWPPASSARPDRRSRPRSRPAFPEWDRSR